MNWIKRLFGYIICSHCGKDFRKKRNSSCGIVQGKDVTYCDNCSNQLIKDTLNGKEPFSVED